MDGGCGIFDRVGDDTTEFLRRRGNRNIAGFFHESAVFVGLHNRHDITIEDVDNLFRRTRAGTDAEPGEGRQSPVISPCSPSSSRREKSAPRQRFSGDPGPKKKYTKLVMEIIEEGIAAGFSSPSTPDYRHMPSSGCATGSISGTNRTRKFSPRKKLPTISSPCWKPVTLPPPALAADGGSSLGN